MAFLARLHYRGVLKGRVPAVHSLERLTRLLTRHLGLDIWDWGERGCDFTLQWQRLDPWQRQAVLPALDLARHMLDAFNRSATPLDQPGLVLLEEPDRHCPAARFPDWASLMDELFPTIQFLATLPAAALGRFPAAALSGRLRLPQGAAPTQPKRGAIARVAPGTVVLVQVDGRLPNLALMKLSRHLQSQGRHVRLTSGDARIAGAEAVYASCVFSSPASLRRVERLRAYYGEALVAGGSGVDLGLRLPPEIEDLPPDLDLYPELGDRAIGFVTRGCPNRCPFCVVPRKEGGVRRVSDLDSLLQGRTRLILLDDNLLAHPDAGAILEDMARRQVEVNFTQTLDIRLLDATLAALLRRIQCANTGFTRRVYHFSLNNVSGLSRVRENYGLLGFSRTDNVEFVCMYGFDTTLEEDVERLRFLRSLPGAYVFMQEYQPVSGGPLPPPRDFFDAHADRRLDELVRILFPQNMKSVERYFRWLSRRYAAQFGRLHPRLVDTIFRYNHRRALSGHQPPFNQPAPAAGKDRLAANPAGRLLTFTLRPRINQRDCPEPPRNCAAGSTAVQSASGSRPQRGIVGVTLGARRVEGRHIGGVQFSTGAHPFNQIGIGQERTAKGDEVGPISGKRRLCGRPVETARQDEGSVEAVAQLNLQFLRHRGCTHRRVVGDMQVEQSEWCQFLA